MTEYSVALGRMPARLQRLRDRLEPLLRRSVHAAFDATGDEIFAIADAATSNQTQNDWFEAMRQIRLSRREFEGSLLKQVAESFAAAVSSEYSLAVPQSSEQDWQWLDQAVLEAGINVEARAQLHAHERAFQSLLSNSTNQGAAVKVDNPASLAHLCWLFNRTLPEISLPSQARQMLYRQFYIQLLGQLGTLYDSSQNSPVVSQRVDAESDEDQQLSQDLLVKTLSKLNRDQPFQNIRKQLATLHVSTQETHAIDVIGALFKVLLSDKGLVDENLMLLQRLQLPVLALALRDPDFLSQHEHPARRLLNRLTKAVSDTTDSQMLHDAVERIDSEVWSNPRIFETVYAELNQGDVALNPVLGQRLQDAEQARIEAEQARAYVEQVVMAMLAPIVEGRPVPEVVEKILRGPWHNVMLLTYLNEGEQSLRWSQQLHAARELIWSVCGSFESVEELMQRLPVLLNELREGFDTIAHDPFELNELLKELEALHLQRMTTPSVVFAANVDEVAQGASAVTQASMQTNDLDKLLQSGGWYERRDLDGNWLRCRLAAVIKTAGLHIFVDAQGDKIAEMKSPDVFRALEDGSLRAIEGNQLFDRALESVITGQRIPR